MLDILKALLEVGADVQSFKSENYFVDKESFNPDIANLFIDSPEEFDKEVFGSAMKSINEKYNDIMLWNS